MDEATALAQNLTFAHGDTYDDPPVRPIPTADYIVQLHHTRRRDHRPLARWARPEQRAHSQPEDVRKTRRRVCRACSASAPRVIEQPTHRFDIRHMPQGCATWPAVWEVREDGWPNYGEVDIVEGVNDVSPNRAALHTSANCTMPAGALMTGCASPPPFSNRAED